MVFKYRDVFAQFHLFEWTSQKQKAAQGDGEDELGFENVNGIDQLLDKYTQKLGTPTARLQPFEEPSFAFKNAVLSDQIARMRDPSRRKYNIPKLEDSAVPATPQTLADLSRGNGWLTGYRESFQRALKSQPVKRGLKISAIVAGFALPASGASFGQTAVLAGMSLLIVSIVWLVVRGAASFGVLSADVDNHLMVPPIWVRASA